MTDLRTRIVSALARADQDWCSDRPLYEDMADAVIAELHLETTERYPTSCGTEVCLKGHYTKWVGND